MLGTVKLPPAFSVKEAQFIGEWWPDHKLPKLKLANGQSCRILDRKSPFPGSSFIRCKCEAFIEIKKGEKEKRKIKTATILVLNEWIK